MRAVDDGDDEENTVYLGDSPHRGSGSGDVLDPSGGDVSSHGSDAQGYKPLIHGANRGHNSLMPGFVNDSVDVVSGRVADIVSHMQRTFEVKENLDRLITGLQCGSFALAVTALVIILAQHSPRHQFQFPTNSGSPPTLMPTYGPGEQYNPWDMLGKLVVGVPTSYVYQSYGCMRECYRSPLYNSPDLTTLQQSCSSQWSFVGVRNAASDLIEIGTFQQTGGVLRGQPVTVPKGTSQPITGSVDSGYAELFWYFVTDGTGKQAMGFSKNSEITVNGIEPVMKNGFDCESTFFFTAVTASPVSATDYAGTSNCERFSNSEQSLGAMHELLIFHNTCDVW
jgi:hypothetical protein